MSTPPSGPRLDHPGVAAPTDPPEWRARVQALEQRARRGMVLGLERVASALAELGHPERGPPSVHVVGSNGKGSVVAFLSSILSADHRVGSFTSPHLERLTERVRRVSERRVVESTPNELERAFRTLDAVRPDFGDLTFFEILTLAGLLTMRDWAVDRRVVEAGLGGRLDATRLVEAQVAVLTQLSLEHTQYLGPDLASIATEKAAVARPGAPLVTAPVPAEAREAVSRAVQTVDGSWVELGVHFDVRAGQGGWDLTLGDRRLSAVRLGLRGAHQARNAALAAEAAIRLDPGLDDRALRLGLAEARWPGRLELVRGDPPVVLDGAQNAAGAQTLARALDAGLDDGDEDEASALRGPPVLVFGAMQDKDVGAMLAALAPRSAALVLTRVALERAASLDVLAAAAPAGVAATRCEDVGAALTAALSDARRRRGWVLVCGSLYLVGAARRELATAFDRVLG